jgi:SM-20-related protein
LTIETFVSKLPLVYQDSVFSSIADNLTDRGYAILPAALPLEMADALVVEASEERIDLYSSAGIGRGTQQIQNEFVRKDEIRWINGQTPAEQQWLQWCAELQNYLNRRLFLGLFSFESHFSHYRPGDFYKRHVDAFKGQANRVLSIVAYLNPQWAHDDGGELVLYQDVHDLDGIRVTPLLGSIAIFLSEEFPHEVLPTQRDRYAIAGWFRVNSSIGGQIDPPK